MGAMESRRGSERETPIVNDNHEQRHHHHNPHHHHRCFTTDNATQQTTQALPLQRRESANPLTSPNQQTRQHSSRPTRHDQRIILSDSEFTSPALLRENESRRITIPHPPTPAYRRSQDSSSSDKTTRSAASKGLSQTTKRKPSIPDSLSFSEYRPKRTSSLSRGNLGPVLLNASSASHPQSSLDLCSNTHSNRSSIKNTGSAALPSAPEAHLTQGFASMLRDTVSVPGFHNVTPRSGDVASGSMGGGCGGAQQRRQQQQAHSTGAGLLSPHIQELSFSEAAQNISRSSDILSNPLGPTSVSPHLTSPLSISSVQVKTGRGHTKPAGTNKGAIALNSNLLQPSASLRVFPSSCAGVSSPCSPSSRSQAASGAPSLRKPPRSRKGAAATVPQLPRVIFGALTPPAPLPFEGTPVSPPMIELPPHSHGTTLSTASERQEPVPPPTTTAEAEAVNPVQTPPFIGNATMSSQRSQRRENSGGGSRVATQSFTDTMFSPPVDASLLPVFSAMSASNGEDPRSEKVVYASKHRFKTQFAGIKADTTRKLRDEAHLGKLPIEAQSPSINSNIAYRQGSGFSDLWPTQSIGDVDEDEDDDVTEKDDVMHRHLAAPFAAHAAAAAALAKASGNLRLPAHTTAVDSSHVKRGAVPDIPPKTSEAEATPSHQSTPTRTSFTSFSSTSKGSGHHRRHRHRHSGKAAKNKCDAAATISGAEDDKEGGNSDVESKAEKNPRPAPLAAEEVALLLKRLSQHCAQAVQTAVILRENATPFFFAQQRDTMRLYEVLGLESDVFYHPPNKLQKRLKRYRFPPPKMRALRALPEADAETIEYMIGSEEMKRRAEMQASHGGAFTSVMDAGEGSGTVYSSLEEAFYVNDEIAAHRRLVVACADCSDRSSRNSSSSSTTSTCSSACSEDARNAAAQHSTTELRGDAPEGAELLNRTGMLVSTTDYSLDGKRRRQLSRLAKKEAKSPAKR